MKSCFARGCHFAALSFSPSLPEKSISFSLSARNFSTRQERGGRSGLLCATRGTGSSLITEPSIMPTDASIHRGGLSGIFPIDTILFDIDGTLCDSDPIHYFAFREMLQEVGYNGGEPITEEFFAKNISGGHNDDLARFLFPDWDFEKAMKFMEDKEVLFRRLAAEKLRPVQGLQKLCKWVDDRQLKRAAVTNAPRENAELMISILGLSEFFQVLVVGSECKRAKPYPDPYLKALDLIGSSPDHAFIFEDSASGIKAGVAAGMPVVGLRTRNPEEVLLKAGATFLIQDFEDRKLWTELEEDERRAAVAVKGP